MDPQTYKRIEAIVDELLSLEPEARQRRVAHLTRTEPDLWPRIEELLAADERLESAPLMATPLEHTWSKDPSLGQGAASMPERIGRYRVLSRLGEGGMGSVYQAEETVPVRREVAIKVTHGLQSPRQQARFALEAQALAMMRHPNIASLYEFGATEDGAPFVVMELIDGSTNIVEWCDRQKATLTVRVELFLQVCAGVAHAHEKGILHRDLKPANVLISEVDGEPTVKVIDFGIARSFGGQGTETITQEYFAGSPVYMSPEAAGVTDSQQADTRSDVYSLGLLLCELISGELPFDPGSGLAELLTRMRNREAERPTDRIRRLDEANRAERASLRSTTPARWHRGLSGDLDAIVLKSVEFDRERRYPSPRDLARDLRRHLAREPISARPAEWGYVLRRFIWKRKGWVAAVLAVVLSLSVGLISRSIEAKRAREAAQRAEESALVAAQVSNFLQDLFDIANPRRSADTPPTVMELLDTSVERLEAELVDQPRVRARLFLRLSQVHSNLGRTEDAEVLAGKALALAEESVDPG